MSDQPKDDQKPHEPTENTATITVSLDKPEMANIQGGLFVVTIPLNSQTVNRIVATGWLQVAAYKLNGIYESIEEVKRRNAEKIQRADASILNRAGKIINGIIRP